MFSDLSLICCRHHTAENAKASRLSKDSTNALLKVVQVDIVTCCFVFIFLMFLVYCMPHLSTIIMHSVIIPLGLVQLA